MTDWSSYKITSKDNHNGYIRFNLDGQVPYSDNEEKTYINLTDTSPFSEWGEGDKIKIYTPNAKEKNSNEVFTFWDSIVFQSSSHWKDEYNKVQEKLNQLKTEKAAEVQVATIEEKHSKSIELQKINLERNLKTKKEWLQEFLKYPRVEELLILLKGKVEIVENIDKTKKDSGIYQIWPYELKNGNYFIWVFDLKKNKQAVYCVFLGDEFNTSAFPEIEGFYQQIDERGIIITGIFNNSEEGDKSTPTFPNIPEKNDEVFLWNLSILWQCLETMNTPEGSESHVLGNRMVAKSKNFFEEVRAWYYGNNLYNDLKKWKEKFEPKTPQEVYDKVIGLEAQNAKLMEERLQRIKKELVNFYQKMGIDDDPIKKKYGENFFTIIEGKINLSNEEDAKRAFKVVACICATEEFIKEDGEYQDTEYRPEKLQGIYKEIIKGWKEVEKYQPINGEKNPLYLEIVEKEWKTHKANAEGLMSKYVKEELTRAITIDPNDLDLPRKKTIYQVSREKSKGGAKDYLDWLKQEYQSAAEGIDKLWNAEEVKKDWEPLSDGQGEESSWIQFIRYFTNDDTVVGAVRKDGKAKISQLFSDDSSDDDIKKSLKTQPAEDLLKDLGVYKADEVAFTVELFKNYYFEWLPKYIKAGLDEKLTLNDLDQEEWKKIRQKLFTDLYNSWGETSEEKDLNHLKTKLDEDIKELDNLIEKAQKKVKEAQEKYNVNPDDLAQANQWIKDHISDKTRIEDLPSEADIDNNNQELDSAKFPPGFKEEIKATRLEKELELSTEPTAVKLGKIKLHLMRTRNKWKWWENLVDNKKNREEDYAIALMYDQNFRRTVAEEMLPKIEVAIKTNTLDGYKNLNKEWGENKIDDKGEVEYNTDREFFEAWKTLRALLGGEEAGTSNYEKIKAWIIANYFGNGEEEWKQIEAEAKIEIKN